MKIFTYLPYLNSVQPRHSIFVEQRLRQLLVQQDVQAQVAAPCRGFRSVLNGLAGNYARAARHEWYLGEKTL